MSGEPEPTHVPLRIVLVANTLPPADLSGVGEQVLQLSAGLTARGHQVVICGRGAGGAPGPKLLFPLTAVLPALRLARRWRADLVQVHESDGGLVALAVRIARAVGVLPRRLRLVALQQVSYVEEQRAVRPLQDRVSGEVLARPGAVEKRFRWFKAPLHVVLGRLTARLADLVLAPSAATAAELARDYQLATLPSVLPNATGGVPIATAARPLPGEPGGYLLFVGRLRIRKGLEVLLRALADLASAGQIVVPALWVAGSGEHAAAVADMAKRLGLLGGEAPRVRFLGRASPGEVRALLADAVALVVPSTYEGMPLVILEAMAQGVPVVASRVSGIPEVVRDGSTGWLVPAEDSRALAAALQELLSQPDEARRRGAQAQLAVRLYAPEVVAGQWLEAIHKLR